MSAFNFSIDLPVRSEWKNIDLLRTSVQNCFIAVFSDQDGCHAISMITGELVENAVKYGDWGGDQKSFRLRVSGDSDRATVTVENPVNPDEVRELTRTIDWIEAFDSTEDAYRAKLLEIANRPPGQGSSKLGLVRVAYEGGCTLRAEVTREVLRVTATMRFEERPTR